MSIRTEPRFVVCCVKVSYMEDANMAAIHAKRVTIMWVNLHALH